LFEALVIVAIVVAVQLWQTRGLPAGEAPPLSGALLDGSQLSLVDVLVAAGGKPVLVAFWATWCAVCKAEAGGLDAIAADRQVVAVATNSGSAADVRKYLAERGRTLPTVNDADGQLAMAWRVQGLPTHFVIDARGHVRFRVVGYATEWGLRARLWWAEKFAG
jgi:thiol-disulfide isomerase/thioredoxin